MMSLQEDVTCDFEMVSYSPQPLVSLIDKPSQQALVSDKHFNVLSYFVLCLHCDLCQKNNRQS